MKRPARLFAAAAFSALWAAAWALPVAAHDDISHPMLFVPNKASADVAVIDTASNRVVARISVGNVPHQVAVSHSLGKLVVSNTDDGTITIVDLATWEIEATVRLGAAPEHMEISPDGGLVAVGNIAEGTVSLVALAEGRETARIGGLYDPHNMTFSADGALLYVANLGAGHVSVIDVARAAVVNEIRIAGPAVVAALPGGGGPDYQGVVNVTATLDGRLGFAAHGESDSVAVIDLRRQKVVARIAVGDEPWRAYASADGRYMLVPNNGDGTVSVISTATLEVVATLPGATGVTGVNSSPTGATAFVISRAERRIVVLDLVRMGKVRDIALPSTPETGVVSPDNGRLYVALSGSDQVAVIDGASDAPLSLIDGVGGEPWGAMIPGARNYCH